MSSIHPHWESEGTEIPVRVRDNTLPSNAKTVSRQPAAIVGMLTVVAAGYLFFEGVDSLRGQVAPSGNQGGQKTITITDNGLSPAVLEVEHGETITWVNQQSTPHILESPTLCSDTGYCLQTKTLFEGESDNFTITLDMQAGSYNYTSATSSDIQGEIIITTTAAPDFEEITSALDHAIFGNNIPSDTPTTPPPQNSGFTPPPPQQPPVTANTMNPNIPRNPYTAESQRVHPFDSEGNPIESAFQDVPAPATTTTNAPRIPSNGRGPLRQPETGAGGVWVIVLGSIAMLWYASAHSLRKTYRF